MELIVAEEAPVGALCPTVLAIGIAAWIVTAAFKKSLHRPNDLCWHALPIEVCLHMHTRYDTVIAFCISLHRYLC